MLSDELLMERAGCHDLEIYDPENQTDIHYILIQDNDGHELGVIVFHAVDNPWCAQGHVNYLPKYWGRNDLHEHTKEACQWIFDNTDYIKILGFIPEKYPQVLGHALNAGLVEEGTLRNSIMIDGKPYNQTIVGLSK